MNGIVISHIASLRELCLRLSVFLCHEQDHNRDCDVSYSLFGEVSISLRVFHRCERDGNQDCEVSHGFCGEVSESL